MTAKREEPTGEKKNPIKMRPVLRLINRVEHELDTMSDGDRKLFLLHMRLKYDGQPDLIKLAEKEALNGAG